MAQSQKSSATDDDLGRQIEALKSDVSDISKTLAQMGAERRDETVDGVRRAASGLRARGADAADQISTGGMALGEEAADAVRRNPGSAMALAVGAGFIVGLMTGRR
ncbi:DUF883 family protein [Rhodovulum euryhalinum]|uniref:Uncharacterized protein DUF883 n=1 Tax=Rhodovulum euryhalinum TaxID=35805 RepID=A0A4R2KGH6_9RHOB|nr:DUF883 family protein [Rhodovulum euryhalinum]TCO69556.1 uncharacterized protein DUF883 [Rhodovulum euryhalinum]